ncbi:hypothetical protein QUF72_04375 [Desulfobacterales bacterium HSG2]|nr:hypothetical protein [Desulfobacterales bacterium HSG2]
MQNMTYALEERIGDPSLFCGRKREMELMLNWAGDIPRKISKSRALLGRRKSGKTAIMQRLFNILWNQEGRVVPFYIEVPKHEQWLLDFSDLYFRTFVSQYFSFQTRTVLLPDNAPWDMDDLESMGRDMGHDNVIRRIGTFRKYFEAGRVENARSLAFHTPGWFAGMENFFALVMIDEIQFMTKYIFRDEDCKIPTKNLPGAYHGLSESKITPMLVSGSYVGWMTRMMREMFKGGRLKRTPISPKLAPDKGLEAVYRYAENRRETVSDESAVVINFLTQSDPFYIAALFRSDWADRDFTSVDGAIRTLAYEVMNRDGEIFGTWSEYIDSTMKEVNDRHAKKILLFLSRERFRECTRDEIRDHLAGKLDDRQLEKRLSTLEYGDLVSRGSSNFRYCGIPDDILDLIFRDLYQEEIDRDRPDVESELAAKVRKLEREKKSLQGTVSELRGRIPELMVYRELNKCGKERKLVRNFRQRLRPAAGARLTDRMEEILTACCESRFDTVRMNYHVQLPGIAARELDVLAEGSDADTCHALVFEMKNRDEKNPPSEEDAESFVTKVDMLKQHIRKKGKNLRFVCPVYLSAKGFEPDVEAWLHEHGVFTSDMECWDQSSE